MSTNEKSSQSDGAVQPSFTAKTASPEPTVPPLKPPVPEGDTALAETQKDTNRSASHETRVVQSDALSPLPGGARPTVTLDMTKKMDEVLNIDKDTVVYLIYLLYRTNMIARNNLRNMIDEISKPLPKDVLKWLVNEAAKVGR